MTPVADGNGSSTITVTVDDGTTTSDDTFVQTVTSVNDAPILIEDISNQTTDEDVTLSGLAFTITDVDDVLDCVSSMSASSDNPTLLSTGNIIFAGTAPNCSVSYIPTANEFGSSLINLTVSDGQLSDTDGHYFIVNAVNDAPVANNDT